MRPSQLEDCEEEDDSKLRRSSHIRKPYPKYVDGDFVEVICNVSLKVLIPINWLINPRIFM